MTERFHVADAQVKAIVDSLSSTNDQELHYSEFLAAMVSTRIAMHDEHLIATFRRFDTDNSGYISRKNLSDVLTGTFDPAEIDQLVKDMHADENGRVSYQDFMVYLKQGGAAEHHEDAALRIIDSNRKDLEEVNKVGEDGKRQIKVPAPAIVVRSNLSSVSEIVSPKNPSKDPPMTTSGTSKASKTCSLL